MADLILNGNVTLTGGGTLNLVNYDRVYGSGILSNFNTIQGYTNSTSYSLGLDQIGITNQATGVINANVSGQTLFVNPNAADGLVNQGVMRASNGGTLYLDGGGGGTFNNSGTIEALTGSALQFNGAVISSGLVDVGSGSLSVTGSYTQTGGTFRLAGGTVTSSTALNFTGGLVDARGTINAAITNSANLQPALGGSGLAVNGSISLLSASKLTFQLGGLTQGSQYGFINVNGTVGLNGQLVVSFVNSFQPNSNNNFTVLTSSSQLSGSFTNVLSGNRVFTSDSSGTFLVTYDGNSVVLSDFEPNLSAPAPVVNGSGHLAATASRNRTAAGVARNSDEPRNVSGAGTAISARGRTPRVAITLQNTNQLQDLMDGPVTTAPNGTVIVHPVPPTATAGKGRVVPPTQVIATRHQNLARNAADRGAIIARREN